MRSVVIFIVLLFGCANMYAQDDLMKWAEHRPLQWEDFVGTPNDTSNYDAEAFAEIRYRYNFYNLKDFSFDVSAGFNKHASWSKHHRRTNNLLKHEQVHFDIAELFARKLKAAFYSYRYTSNFKVEIERIFKSYKTAYHKMQKQYDDETDHSLKADKQKEWEDFVSTQLKKTKPVTIRLASAR